MVAWFNASLCVVILLAELRPCTPKSIEYCSFMIIHEMNFMITQPVGRCHE